MANTVRGRIFAIGNIEQIPYQNTTFLKRSFIIDSSRFDSMTGEKFSNYIKFELASKHLNDIDNFKVGDFVEVSFSLIGKPKTDNGKLECFTNIIAYKIEKIEQQKTVNLNQQINSSKEKINQTFGVQQFPPMVQGSGMPNNQQTMHGGYFQQDEKLPF